MKKQTKGFKTIKGNMAAWSKQLSTMYVCILKAFYEVMGNREKIVPGAKIDREVSFPRVNEGVIAIILRKAVVIDADDMTIEYKFSELSNEELLQILDITIQTIESEKM